MNSSNYFYRANLSFIPKSDRDVISKEYWRPITLINIDNKILNTILPNIIQCHSKKIIHFDKVEHIPEIEGWFNIRKSTNIWHDNEVCIKNYHLDC